MINEDVPGIKVTLQIGGADAVEYAPDQDAADEDPATCPTITKYVECIDNAPFSVKVAVTEDYNWSHKNHDLCYYLYIDGTYVDGSIASSNDRIARNIGFNDHQTIFKGFDTPDTTRGGQWTRRQFKFSSVQLGIEHPSLWLPTVVLNVADLVRSGRHGS